MRILSTPVSSNTKNNASSPPLPQLHWYSFDTLSAITRMPMFVRRSQANIIPNERPFLYHIPMDSTRMVPPLPETPLKEWCSYHKEMSCNQSWIKHMQLSLTSTTAIYARELFCVCVCVFWIQNFLLSQQNIPQQIHHHFAHITHTWDISTGTKRKKKSASYNSFEPPCLSFCSVPIPASCTHQELLRIPFMPP